MTIRILIADDHGVLRAGLAAMLSESPDLVIVAQASTAEETLAAAREHQADVILLDLNMPGPSGLPLIAELTSQVPNSRILVLTVHDDEGLVRRALQGGASGYIPKRAAGGDLISAVRAVGCGDIYIHSSLLRGLIDLPPSAPEDTPDSPHGQLSPRENQVLRLVALGNTNRQIAEALYLSIRTIERHRSNLMTKLGLERRSDLVRYAKRNGLLD